MTQSVCVRPQTTWDTYSPCRGLRLRGLTQVVSDRSPCPHWPRLLAPHEITSSGVMATVCSSLHASQAWGRHSERREGAQAEALLHVQTQEMASKVAVMQTSPCSPLAAWTV